MCQPEYAQYAKWPTLTDEVHALSAGPLTYVVSKGRGYQTITVYRDGQPVHWIIRGQVMRCPMAHAYEPATGDKYVRYHFLGKSGTHAFKMLAGRIKNGCRTAHKAR